MTPLERYEELMDLEWFKEYLQKNLEPLLRPELDKFKTMSDPTSRLHLSLGMYLRNEWGLWEQNGKTDLILWFNKLGIYHPDDMSTICIETYHRMVNAKPIELETQVQKFKDFWKENGYPDWIYKELE